MSFKLKTAIEVESFFRISKYVSDIIFVSCIIMEITTLLHASIVLQCIDGLLQVYIRNSMLSLMDGIKKRSVLMEISAVRITAMSPPAITKALMIALNYFSFTNRNCLS